MRGLIRFLGIFFIAYANSISAHVHEYSLNLDGQTQFANDSITYFPIPSRVKQCICSANNGMSSDEIAYLLGISKNGIVSAETFCIGLERLKEKNVFSKLIISIEDHEDGLVIGIKAEAFWTIKSIKVEGVSLGKQSIVHLYQLRIGERFCKEKHELSLQDIVKDLNKKGYLDASVEAFFTYEPVHKSIQVILVVVKGRLYFIDTVNIKITSDQDEIEKKKIDNFLYKKIVKYLLYKPYSEEFIIKKIKLARQLLVAEGFVYAKVSSSVAVNTTNKVIGVTLQVTFDCAQKINFLGNSYFPSSYLIKSVMECTHAIGIIPSVILAEEMIDIYRAKGFFDVTIDTSEDAQNYYFMIHEGARTKLESIVIRGAEFTYSDYIVKRFFKHLLHGYSDEKKIKIAMQQCISWYKNEGFWDVEFLKKEYIPTHKNTVFKLVCILNEGSQRLWKGVVIEGFSECSKDLLQQTYDTTKKIMPLSEKLLARQKELLEKECKKYGYTNPRVSYELLEHEGVYTILWHVNRGKRMKFGKTIIKGTLVDHTKILNLLPFKEDDYWNKDKLNQLYKKFRNLGVYKSIGVQQHTIQEPHEMADIILTLEEDDPFEVKVRMGFQQISKNFAFKKGSSYKVGGGFIWKNPLSRLDTLTIDTSLSLFERKTFIAYKQSLFFSIPIDTVIKGYSNYYMNPVSLGSRKILYEALQDGFLFGLNSKQEKYQIGMTTGFEWMKIKNISVGLSEALRFVPELIDQRVPYWFCEPTMYFDYLDSDVDPHHGYFLFASMKTMIPFDLKATPVLKLMIENGCYASWHGITGAIRVRGGNIFMQNFDSIMPPERFYLGGPNSIRSYQPDKCPPLGVYVNEDGCVEWIPQGGKSMLNANFELRFPLPLQNLQAALFQDFGILAPNIQHIFHEFSPLAASGFGIRYVTPFGPLRFDIGWKWKKQYDLDNSYAWFLTFGYAF